MLNRDRTEAYVWSTWPYFSPDEITAVNDVLKSGKVNYWTGTQCRLFEHEFAEAMGAKYAICVMNGTVAIEAALYALDIGAGDEVITTSRTFIASASTVIMRGATPIFADVDPNSQNITAESVEKVITARTKAIIAVHLAGWPCEMEALLALAKKYSLYIIEDCAQAHGAVYQNRMIGSWGHISAFSFCQDKIMTTGGEGGMVLTDDEGIYKKIWAFKDHGKSYDKLQYRKISTQFQWLHESFGTNWRMTEMQAAIGRVQLKKLAEWKKIRTRNAAILTQHLSFSKALRLPQPGHHIQHAYYKYYAFIQPEKLKATWTRDKILQILHQNGLPVFVGSCSEIYEEQAFKKALLQPTNRLPIAKLLGETSLMFLVHPTLTEDEMHYMGEYIAAVIQEASL